VAAALPLVLAPVPAEIDAFTSLVLSADDSGSHGFIDDLRQRGLSLERVYLELLAPAARHLGELWEDDRCVFSDVSIALLRLHRMVHGFGDAFQNEASVAPHAARVLLIPLPGEQHSFGLSVVAAFFRRAGWTVSSGGVDSLDDLRRMVRREHFSLIGLSTGCQTQLDTMASSIRMVRRLSRNHNIVVMVGRPLFRDHPELAAAVGADGTAADGRQATLCAEQLLVARTITR
jgi:methanogenic corrinoid protein MtbC1